MANRWEIMETGKILSSWAPKSLWVVSADMKSKTLAPWKNSYDEARQHIQKQRHHFADKYPYSQSYVFSNNHVCMWELDYKEGWVLKNWCFQTVVLEKTLESLGHQGDQTSQTLRKSTLNIHWKDWYWSWSSNTLATWCKELAHWKRHWCCERFRAGEEVDNRGWDGWMASPAQRTWVLENSWR